MIEPKVKKSKKKSKEEVQEENIESKEAQEAQEAQEVHEEVIEPKVKKSKKSKEEVENPIDKIKTIILKDTKMAKILKKTTIDNIEDYITFTMPEKNREYFLEFLKTEGLKPKLNGEDITVKIKYLV